MNNEELQTIAQNIGKNYNYPNVEAAFAEVRDFKVTWQRSYQWISLKVSDYMQDAPEVIISELLDTIFAKIAGRAADYTENVRNWLLSPAFVRRNQPTYLRRSNATYDGRVKEAYNRLRDKGLVESRSDLAFCSKELPTGKPGTASMLLQSVIVDSDLVDNASDDVLDLVVLVLTRHICRRWPAENVHPKMLALGLDHLEDLFLDLEDLGYHF